MQAWQWEAPKSEYFPKDLLEIVELLHKKGVTLISNKENINPVKIGLTIAKAYIDLLGGSIEFVNKEGQGTRYHIKIRQKLVNTSQSSVEG